ncbi:glucose--fructose oxidoreductase [Enterobacter cancerogenus]|uniref:Glucose--fructose oxidoreductase n=1 Tax=Enterobacter cancerogenus TaxID=69218 RepID=A0A484XV85_9ENTR|nr:glucose--fructose oxidoreductase [Enterobacter cancerogenus]
MINVAIVGTGNISHNHIQGYLQFGSRCRIVALVDIYPDKAHEKKVRYGLTDARVYESHRQMLEFEPNLDIVDVCTPALRACRD